MRVSRVVACVLMLILCSCATKLTHVTMDPARLENSSVAKVACAYRLQEVVDARPSGDHAGGLSGNRFVFDDVADVVHRQLIHAGLTITADSSLSLSVRVLRFYLNQNNGTKIPVVVYEARIDQQPPFLIRSQQASMNWKGTQNEAYAAYSRVLLDATTQLVKRLNAGCAGIR